MATTRPRKRHNDYELKPLASSADGDDDDGVEYKSKTDQWLNFILHKLHALLWIVIGGALAVHTQLFELIMDGHPPARPQAELGRCARACVFSPSLLRAS